MFKKLFMSMSLSILVLLVSTTGFAQTSYVPQGKFVTPMLMHDTHSLNLTQTEFILTNITGSLVHCNIKVFDQNGNDVSSYSQVISGPSQGTVSVISTGGEFDIPAHCSRWYVFGLRTSSGIGSFGYAIINWTAEDSSLTKALIGDKFYKGAMGSGLGYAGCYPLNSGNPF
ncbi:hypothetical protein [Maridesulfovibrio sp.]|uniref:hypothetical protein n=1 Tax=Maridesulfovibrio sp. TaxID=2795000 RepID=UPI002A1889F6|nr:hypothetical protein [Maridesulfovibrio sp.]